MPAGERVKEPAVLPHQVREIEIGAAEQALWVDAVERLWSHRSIIAKLVIAGLVLSSIAAFVYPKYEATVQLMPPDTASSGLGALLLPALANKPGLNGLTGIAGDLLGTKDSGALFVKVLESRTIEDTLINRFDLRKRYHIKYWEDTRNKLQSRTTITEDKKSGVLKLVVEDRDPQLATSLAAAYIEALDQVMATVATSSARRQRIFLEQRLADEKKFLEDSEKQFGQFASSSMVLDVPQQTRVTVEAAARLQGEMIAARAELEGLEQIYTADNYRTRSLRARVAELEKELAKINGGQGSAGATQDPTNPYPSVKSLPVLGVQWADLYRITKVHETVFELLTQQYEIARIQEAKEIPTVKVLDAPVVSEKRYPRPWIVIILGVLASAALACLWFLLRDRWERWDRNDPRRQLLTRIYSGARGKVRWVRSERPPSYAPQNQEEHETFN
jgi:capsule polysaccharide export protein KpsE/RkpR